MAVPLRIVSHHWDLSRISRSNFGFCQALSSPLLRKLSLRRCADAYRPHF